MKQLTAVLLVTALVCGCSGKKSQSPEELTAYESELNVWHAKRIENIKAPDGWLNLVGLYWLEPGVSTFGSDDKNNIVFPKGKIAAEAGYFTVQGGIVSIHVNKDVVITTQGKPVSEQVVFHPDSASSVILESGSLQWNVIKRDTKTGIRLRDLESDALKTFTRVERFSIDPDYRVEASFEASPDSSHTIAITNVLGQTTLQASPGTLVFDIQGKEHRLDVLKGNKEEFFVIFADATNGKSTYSGGRFLYVKKPEGNKKTYVDFNKAYNPPCVFTPYATCPLPPKQNELPIGISVGEKVYEHLAHNGTAASQ